ncbi:MAG: hypothetical protein P9L99_13715 [Candidatus Lernaella stagnicola]|nr:hypothetical protein [Candidatus Lernaella stagnicola]
MFVGMLFFAVMLSCSSNPPDNPGPPPRISPPRQAQAAPITPPPAAPTPAPLPTPAPVLVSSSPAASGKLPFLSDLTPYEAEIVTAVKAGADADNLLRLAIIMSAKARDEASAQPLIDKFESFITATRPKVKAEQDIWKKGFVLYEEFERVLLQNERRNGGATNYQAGDPRVDTLLREGKYNCYSSAVVYGLAARRFGFEVQGVTMNKHAFVQISESGGREAVEVETTNYGGYGEKHDEEFYRKKTTGLTFADYQKREVMPFERFVTMAHMILNDDAYKLPEADDLRVTEIAGYLDPAMETQLARLRDWYRVCSRSVHADRFAEALRQFDRIGTELLAVYAHKTSNRELNKTAAWMFTVWALAIANARPDREVLKLCNIATQLVDPSDEDFGDINNNATLALQKLARYQLDRGEIEEASTTTGTALNIIRQEDLRDQMREFFYVTLGKKHFDAKEWEKAISAYAQCKDIVSKNGQRQCLDAMETAFLNYGIDLMNQGNFDAAAQVFQKCLETDSRCERCREYLDKARKHGTRG